MRCNLSRAENSFKIELNQTNRSYKSPTTDILTLDVLYCLQDIIIFSTKN